jgi:exopolysaccharide biosynthesis polyprenyl glycosylphosphotransferase
MSFVSTLVREASLDGSPLLAGLLVIAGFLLGLRGVRRGVRRLRHERVLILGGSPLGRQIIEAIERQPWRRYAIVGVVDDVASLGRVIEATRPDRIVVALDERRGRLPLYRLVESLARGIVVEDVAETYERLTGKLALEALAPSSVIFSRDFRVSRLQRARARALSFLVALIGSIVLAPLLGVIVLLIKLDSRGPVFFIQNRVGLSGRPFKVIKFRTMRPVSGPTSEWERDNYDRITRLGRWLRRFRLDELPQLINVLRADMNLVGPRPHPVTNLGLLILAARNLNELTGDAIPYYSLRCAVRPGITGWAQIRHGYANDLDEETEKMRYDLYYIKHMSLWFDLRILVDTVKSVVRRPRSVTAAAPGKAAPAARPFAALNR